MNKEFKFVKVEIIPPQSEEFFELFKNGLPTGKVYSSSHLKFCLDCLSE